MSDEKEPVESLPSDVAPGDHYIPGLAESPTPDHYIPGLAQDPEPSSASDPESLVSPRRGCGTMVLVFLGASAGVAGLLGVLVWVFSMIPTTVPNTVGLRQSTAEQRIAAANLTSGTAGDVPTTDFQSGVVVSQVPVGSSQVPVGTQVNMAVAVAPTWVVVPDVSLDHRLIAETTLSYVLLRPVIYQQLSDTVPFGRVVAQMPRAGQQAMTGQQVAVFISLGQGSGGAVVPSVLGKPSSNAATDIAQVYLVPKWLDAAVGERPGGTVVDQVPAPGTRVPVGSAVPIITTSMAN